MALEERRLDYQMAREPFGWHSDASPAEKGRLKPPTRKRIIRSFEVNMTAEGEVDSVNKENGERPIMVPREKRVSEGDVNDVADNSPNCHSTKPVHTVDGDKCECGSIKDVTTDSLSFGIENHTLQIKNGSPSCNGDGIKSFPFCSTRRAADFNPLYISMLSSTSPFISRYDLAIPFEERDVAPDLQLG